MSPKSVIGRFAPTPSGEIHLGNAFAALLAWLSARSQGGRIVLRVEDLDLARTSPTYTQGFVQTMDWLGLDWDEGPNKDGPHTPYLQSQRGNYYTGLLTQLQNNGLVYPCFCSRAQLHAATAPHASDGIYLYNGHCRNLSANAIKSLSQTRPPAYRIQVPDETISFIDKCQGHYRQNLAAECGDYIVRRSDGVWAYQLAAPADDAAMGITEVVRGKDLLSSTPRQIWLLQTLGLPVPSFAHCPLLLAPDGRRLSKRDGDISLQSFSAKGVSPQALTGLLAWLGGLLPNFQPISPTNLLPYFSWAKIKQNDICLPLNFLSFL